MTTTLNYAGNRPSQDPSLRVLFSSSWEVRISKCSDLVWTWPMGSAWPPVTEKVYFLVTWTHTVAQEGAKVSKHNMKKLWIWPREVPGVTSGHYLWPSVARQCRYTATVTSGCQVEQYVTSVTRRDRLQVGVFSIVFGQNLFRYSKIKIFPWVSWVKKQCVFILLEA